MDPEALLNVVQKREPVPSRDGTLYGPWGPSECGAEERACPFKRRNVNVTAVTELHYLVGKQLAAYNYECTDKKARIEIILLRVSLNFASSHIKFSKTFFLHVTA
jgi:hypothetical protein